LRRGKLLILAEDLSQREKERFKKLAEKFRIPVLEYGEKEKLGKILGRKAVGILLLTNREIANEILKKEE
jgi:ribosomal protein L7Ae-like RNA K-turn-binding protein